MIILFSYCSHVLWWLYSSYDSHYYAKQIIIMIIILTFFILYLCGIVFLLIYKSDRTAVSYVYLLKSKYYVSTFLQLLNSCYHMVGRSSALSLSIFVSSKMETTRKNNRTYYVVVQGLYRFKTSNYQKLYIYPEWEFIIYFWYWYKAYISVKWTIPTKNFLPCVF